MGALSCGVRASMVDYVIVIRSGKMNISIKDTAGERVVATQGPGDIVGERAALRPGSRSATVITACELRAFVIGTAEFASGSRRSPSRPGSAGKSNLRRLTENRLDHASTDEIKPRPTTPVVEFCATVDWPELLHMHHGHNSF